MIITRETNQNEGEILNFTLGLLEQSDQIVCQRAKDAGLNILVCEELPRETLHQDVVFKKIVVDCGSSVIDCELKRKTEYKTKEFICSTIILHMSDEDAWGRYKETLRNKEHYNEIKEYNWIPKLFDNIRINYRYYNDETSDYFEVSCPEKPHGLFMISGK